MGDDFLAPRWSVPGPKTIQHSRARRAGSVSRSSPYLASTWQKPWDIGSFSLCLRWIASKKVNTRNHRLIPCAPIPSDPVNGPRRGHPISSLGFCGLVANADGFYHMRVLLYIYTVYVCIYIYIQCVYTYIYTVYIYTPSERQPVGGSENTASERAIGGSPNNGRPRVLNAPHPSDLQRET